MLGTSLANVLEITLFARFQVIGLLEWRGFVEYFGKEVVEILSAGRFKRSVEFVFCVDFQMENLLT